MSDEDEQDPSGGEHAVIVYFNNYGSRNLDRLFALEDRLIEAVEGAALGIFDGNEIAVDGTDGSLYLYGPDAREIFDAILPILLETPFTRDGRVELWFGLAYGDGVASKSIQLR